MISPNRTFRVFLFIPVTFIFLLIFTFAVYAQGNIRLGKLTVQPAMRYRIEYIDNVFKANTDEENDFIHKFMPKISLNYRGARPENALSVGMNAEFTAYDEFSDNNWQKYSPFVTLSYKMPSGFYLKLSDTYTKTQDPYGSVNEFNVGERTERWNNVLRTTWGYDVTTKYSVEVLYAYSIFRYYNAADKWQEYDRHRYGGTVLYHLTPKMALFAQFRRTEQSYDEQNDDLFDPDRGLAWSSDTSMDFSINDYFLGVRFKPGGKISGSIAAGYTDKTYDNKFDINGKRYEDSSTFGGEATLNYAATTRTNLAFTFSREYVNASDIQEVSQYVATRAGIRLLQKLPRNLLFTGGLRWRNQDYQDESDAFGEKKLNIYTARASIQWTIRDWLLSGFDYKYEVKKANDSDFETDEYTENVVAWYIEATY